MFGEGNAWKIMGVPHMSLSFADWRAIPAGIECARRGLEFYSWGNPCDPWGRPMVYPRIWLWLSVLGLNQNMTDTIGVSLAISFFVALLWTLGRLTTRQGVVVAVMVCSPSVMLAVERGNNDLVIFVILAISLKYYGLPRLRSRLVGYGLVLVAAVLKLYPALALVTLVRERGFKGLLTLGVSAILLALYAIVTLGDIETTAKVNFANTQLISYAYGAKVLVQKLNLILSGTAEKPIPTVLAFAAAALLLIFGLLLGRRNALRQNRILDNDLSRIGGFLMGASIFLGTFLLGNNFDYRLIFLLLTVPQMFVWVNREDSLGLFSFVAILAVVSTLWFSSEILAGVNSILQLYEVLNWVLFAYYAYYASLLLACIRNYGHPSSTRTR
jgi:hypothetical protein